MAAPPRLRDAPHHLAAPRHPLLTGVEGEKRPARWPNAAGATFVVVIAIAAARRPAGVPLLALANLGFHELSHLLFIWAPDLVRAAMGSVGQVLVPIGLAGYFLFVRHDDVGTGVCLGWAGTSAVEWARYLADAPYERLQLIGGDHDWAFVLSELNRIDRAAAYAREIRILAVLLVLAGLVVCLRPWWPRATAHRVARAIPRRRSRWVL